MVKKETSWRTVCFGLFVVLVGLGGLAVALIFKDLIAAVGATLLGFIIGMLVSFFVQEAEQWTRSAMVASVTVLTGAGALALLRYGAPDQHGIWFYPVGLLIGFGFGTVWEEIDP